MPAHVGLLSYVRHIERGQHRILFNAHEGVTELNIAAIFCFAYLYFSPETVVLMIRQKQIGAAGSSRDHCMCLCVSDKVQQDSDRKTFTVFQIEARQQVHEIEAGSEVSIT